MLKADDFAPLHSTSETADIPNSVYKAGGITFAAAIASGFWTYIISVAGTSLGMPLETATLQWIAVAITATVVMTLIALPSATDAPA